MLKQAFVWLDAHPGSYWLATGVASTVLLGWLALLVWTEIRPGTAWRPPRWSDPVVLLVFLLAWRWPAFLAAEQLNPDESLLISAARSLAHDPVFWRSCDAATSGPLNCYILLPIHWLGAPLDYFWVRLVALLMVWGSLWACLSLLRRHFGDAAAGLSILPGAAFFATVTHGDLIHYSSEHFPMLLLAASAALLVGPEAPRGGRAFAGAVLAGAIAWAKLQFAPLALVLLGWATLRAVRDAAPGSRWRTVVRRVIVPASVPTLVIASLAAATGVLRLGWERYFENNLFYVGQSQSLAQAVDAMRRMANIDGRAPLFIETIASLAVFAALLLIVRRTRPGAFTIGAFVLAGAAVGALLAPRREFLHYVLLLPVPLTLLLGDQLGRGWNAFGSGRARLGMALVAIAGGFLVPIVTRAQQADPATFGWFAFNWRYPRSPEAEVIRQLTPPDGAVAVWGWAYDLPVESGRRMATRDPSDLSLWTSGHTNLGTYQQRFTDDIKRCQPVVFVDATGPGAFYYTDRARFAHEIAPELADYVRRNYTEVADLQRSRIFVRNDSSGHPPVDAAKVAGWLARGRPRIQPAFEQLSPADSAALRRKTIGSDVVTLLQPPIRVEWPLSPDIRAVRIEFGFEPTAIAAGLSDGADLIFELHEDGVVRRFYSRRLDPQKRPEDRGLVRTVVPLPPFGPRARLILRTDPGENGNDAWDWIYCRSLFFFRSTGYLPEQFPGFNLPPNSVLAPHATILEQDGNPRRPGI